MTRTARADYPRAVLRDRSESRSGLDTSIRKDGAGQHNWGSIADEQQLEFEAIEDEIREEGEDEDLNALKSANGSATIPKAGDLIPGNANISEDDLEKARQYRKNAFKKHGGKEIDLVHIARTSAAVAGGPPVPRPVQDKMMNASSDA